MPYSEKCGIGEFFANEGNPLMSISNLAHEFQLVDFERLLKARRAIKVKAEVAWIQLSLGRGNME
jgi:hypothetical protein